MRRTEGTINSTLLHLSSSTSTPTLPMAHQHLTANPSTLNSPPSNQLLLTTNLQARAPLLAVDLPRLLQKLPPPPSCC